MARYRHVVWDWNGTLLDDVCLCLEITNQLLRDRSLVLLSLSEYKEQLAFPIEDYYRGLGFDLEAESFEQLSEEFIRMYEARRFECSLQPNVVDVLERLQRRGMTQSILSAYRQETLTELIAHFRIEPYFEAVVGVDNDQGEGKVNQGRRWLEDAKHAPEELLLVGDTLHDLEVAMAMGVQCALVAHGHQSRRRLESHVTAVDDLVSILNLDGITVE